MSKYIRHGMLSEVNKCFGEKSRQGEAWKMWEEGTQFHIWGLERPNYGNI